MERTDDELILEIRLRIMKCKSSFGEAQAFHQAYLAEPEKHNLVEHFSESLKKGIE